MPKWLKWLLIIIGAIIVINALLAFIGYNSWQQNRQQGGNQNQIQPSP